MRTYSGVAGKIVYPDGEPDRTFTEVCPKCHQAMKEAALFNSTYMRCYTCEPTVETQVVEPEPKPEPTGLTPITLDWDPLGKALCPFNHKSWIRFQDDTGPAPGPWTWEFLRDMGARWNYSGGSVIGGNRVVYTIVGRDSEGVYVLARKDPA